MRSYRWWQHMLAKKFFGEDQNGRPVLFFVDDTTAEDLHARAPDPLILNLCATVSEEAIDWGGRGFNRILDAVYLWRARDRSGPPPCLPLLAACVLAATHRKSTGKRGQPAYYPRLAELLTPPQNKQVKDPLKALKGYYSAVPDMWEYLDEWLVDRQGRNGISTLDTRTDRSWVGWAESQALICVQDYERLGELLSFHRDLPPRRLVEKVRRWNGRPRLSRTLQEALNAETESEVARRLGALLAAVARIDVQRKAASLQRLHLKITAKDDADEDVWRLGWLAEALPNIEADGIEHERGQFQVVCEPGQQTYSLSGQVPYVGDGLRSGVSAQGEWLSIERPASRSPLVLQESANTDWVEAKAPVPHKESLLLFSKESEAAARQIVEGAGEEWDAEPDLTSVPGWFVYPELFLDEPEAQEETALRLVGGLRLGRPGERKSYMVGGEPDLEPPPDVDVVLVDGVPLVTGGKRTPLRDLGLQAGEHKIVAGPRSRKFVTRSGPTFPLDAELPRVHRRSEDSTVIDATGAFIDLPGILRPGWWDRRETGLNGVGNSDEIPAEAVWMIVHNADGTLTVRLLRYEEPRITTVSEETCEDWQGMLFIEHPPTAAAKRKLWNRYVSQALTIGFGER